MAIDSAEKRKSISGIQHFMMVGVTPNATLDQEWRQEAGHGYPGILVDENIILPVQAGQGGVTWEFPDKQRKRKRRSRKQLQELIRNQVLKLGKEDKSKKLQLNNEIERQIIEVVREDKTLERLRANQVEIDSQNYLLEELAIVQRELLEYRELIERQQIEQQKEQQKIKQDEEEAIILLLLQD